MEYIYLVGVPLNHKLYIDFFVDKKIKLVGGFLIDERVGFLLKEFFASITPIVCVRKFRSYIFDV